MADELVELLRQNFADMTGFRAEKADDGPGILSPDFDVNSVWERRVQRNTEADGEEYICTISHNAGTFPNDEILARKEVTIDGKLVTCWVIPTIVTVKFRNNTKMNWKLTTFRSALVPDSDIVHSRNGRKQKEATFWPSHKQGHAIAQSGVRPGGTRPQWGSRTGR